MFVCCECRVLSGRGLCDELITRPEESYRLYCVVVCDLATSRIGVPYIYDISNLRINWDAEPSGYIEIRIIGFFLESGLYWQFKVCLLLLQCVTAYKPFDHA
jgi:hypothetical protein